MKTAYKVSKITMISSAVLAGLLLILMVVIIMRNKDLLKKGSTREDGDGDDERYKRMKANAEDDSDIGESLVRNAINKKSGLTLPDGGKISTKSLVI